MIFNYVWLKESSENILEYYNIANENQKYFPKVKKKSHCLRKLIEEARFYHGFNAEHTFPLYVEFDCTIDIAVIIFYEKVFLSNILLVIIPTLNCSCVIDTTCMDSLSLEDVLSICIRKGHVLCEVE